MKNKTIMMVEDEAGIRELTEMYLRKEGYEVISFQNGEQALHELEKVSPHLILLDIEMPGLDGFTVCEKIRKKTTVPIIFLTVRREMLDKVKCFEIGGDDYVTKPFEFDELVARINANIRRYFSYPKKQQDILKYDDLEIHLHNYKCFLNGKSIDLTAKETELLIHLAKHPNQVWSQEQLYESIWAEEAIGNFDTVKVHINYLRRKLEQEQPEREYIETVRGFGYLFTG